MEVNLLRQMVFGTPRRPTNVLEQKTPKRMLFWKVSQYFHENLFFVVVEMLAMDGCSKNSNNLSYKTPMDQQ